MRKSSFILFLTLISAAMLLTVGCRDARYSSTEGTSKGTTSTTSIAPLTEDEQIQVRAIMHLFKEDSGFGENPPFNIIYLCDRTQTNMIGGIVNYPLLEKSVSKGVFQGVEEGLKIDVIPADDLKQVVDRTGKVMENGIYMTVTIILEKDGRKYIGATIYKGPEGVTYITYEVKQISPDIILLPVSKALS